MIAICMGIFGGFIGLNWKFWRDEMELSDVVKIKKNISVTDLSGEKVMIDFDSGKYFMIKGVGNDIWDIVQEEVTVENIIEKLLSEYNISREDCEKSVLAFLEKLKELEFI